MVGESYYYSIEKNMSKEIDGNEVRIIRESLGLNQVEFAQKVGTTRVSVWAWESGRAKPSPMAREKLAVAKYYSKSDKETPHQF